MNRIRRMLVSFCVVCNIAGFGLIFLVLANTSGPGDVVFVASGDAIVMFTIALFGLFLNMILAFALWKGSLRSRDLERRLDRARI